MMLNRYYDAEDFEKHASPFLLQHEAEHNLMLGLIYRAIQNPEAFEGVPYMATILDGDDVVAVSMRTPPHNVLLSHIAPEHLESVVDLLIEDYQATYDSVPGVLGEKITSKYFADQWTARTGQTFVHKMKERIYQLEVVQPVHGVSGGWRIADGEDKALIMGWFKGFQQEALGETSDADELETLFERYVMADHDLLIWEDGGQPVSMVGISGVSPNGARVGAVYTPPEHRRKGYASAVVAVMSQQIMDSGKQYCFLYTDLNNPTSNHIYQEIGYRPVVDIDMYKFV